jgi:uncharacterized protein (UPF0332 family)
MEKAGRALKTARRLLPEDKAAVNRAYSAAFYAATAALLAKGENPETHKGTPV